MNKILIALLLACSVSLSQATTLLMPVVSVTDGDTIRSSLRLPCPLCNVSVRILGIDTPESTRIAKCPAERIKGIEAKEFLKSFVGNEQTMTISNFKWDKYGGRVTANVRIRDRDIGDLMIEKGFAKRYTGSGPRPDWCT